MDSEEEIDDEDEMEVSSADSRVGTPTASVLGIDEGLDRLSIMYEAVVSAEPSKVAASCRKSHAAVAEAIQIYICPHMWK